MHEFDLNRVEFYSKEDMAAGHHLQKGEHILKADIKPNYGDINEVLELSSKPRRNTETRIFIFHIFKVIIFDIIENRR